MKKVIGYLLGISKRAAQKAITLFHKAFPQIKLHSAKAHWANKRNQCQLGPVLFEAVPEEERPTLRRVLEFGCNWGGNLGYFMERIEGVTCLGIDINSVVHELEPAFPGRYKGVVGNETALVGIKDTSFDLAMTSSVLDHIPSRKVICEVIANLARVSRNVILLEPYFEGIEGDVSGKLRAQISKNMPNPHKPFAEHSYFWNYDQILNDLGLQWRKAPRPLHGSSLGPFYHLYWIAERR